ncbi:uncharacterized protein LOC142333931 isoform X2 [Lycorma delicatula]|uniref:uncharacterized protein LOC142333931 isoform X2 n=1 Tax=Lycorma delicatula TaxID=130591 RepID=UPI003F517111
MNGDIEKDSLAIEQTNLVKSENLQVENNVESEISLNDVSPQLNLNMKTNELEINDLHTVKTEEEMELYPCHINFIQLKEEPLDIMNDDIEKDPLAIEETNIVKSENLQVENEVESEISLNYKVSPQLNLNMKTNELEINDLHTVKTEEEIEFYPGHQIDFVQLKEEPLDVDGDIEKDPLAIEEVNFVKSENLQVENEVVTIDEGTIKGSMKNCITCKRCVNNSVHDGIIKKNSIECNCAYGAVTTEENLVENISSENKLPIQKEKKSVCEYCNELVGCKCYLKRRNNFHGKKKKKNISEKSLIQDNDSKTHLITRNEEKNYICNFCQKCFNQSSTLKSHLNIHTNEKSYICNICQKSFNQKNNLKRHINIHTKEKNFVCNFCQKVFYQLSNLKIHLNIHTKEKNYVCNVCQKVLSRASCLKKHLNIHTKEKNYVCNFCQKVLNCSSSLKAHLNIHTKEKNYVCNYCQRSFNRSFSLKSHLNVHTKEKNYVCNICQKVFNHLCNLKKHINVHTKRKNCL